MKRSPDESKKTYKADILNRVVEMAVAIQQIPAPPFNERHRSQFVQQAFTGERLAEVETDQLGNVYARLTGEGNRPPLIVSAHIDTVFPISTDLSIRQEGQKICGPGIGDNAMGVAGLFGLLWSLQKRDARLPGDVWLVANVGEEGLGNLSGMKAVVDRFDERALAYIVLEGMALGQVYHRGLAVQRYSIQVTTPGGHSWVDHGQPSAIFELAGLISQLRQLALPSHPRTVLNVGIIGGGTSINTIASNAHLELDLRSESVFSLNKLCSLVEEIVSSANRNTVNVRARVIGQRPPGDIPGDHPLVSIARRCLEAQGLQAHLNIGSTDANVPLSRGLPAVCIGMTTGYGAHTSMETVSIPPLIQGLSQLEMLVDHVFHEL